MEFDGFDWDAGSRDKCRKHGVSLPEIEALFGGGTLLVAPDPRHSVAEERLLGIGPNQAGRMLFVAFTWRRRGADLLIRPISARYMHAKEIATHEEALARPAQRRGG